MEQHIIMPYMVIAVFIISALLSLLHGPFALPDVLFVGIITRMGGVCQALIFFKKSFQMPNSRAPFSSTLLAISSALTPFISAILSQMRGIYPGSLRSPRWGSGAM